MTPRKTVSPQPDPELVARALLLDSQLGPFCASTDETDPARDDRRGRERLGLLLRMLQADEPPGKRGSAKGVDPATNDLRNDALVLGRFRVIEHLGSGGFGFVVRAHDTILNRDVALKMPLPSRVLGSGDLRRFLKEARAAAQLDHPSIVRVHEAGELGGLGYYIAAEFCPGLSLRRWLKAQNEPVPGRLAARWLADLADAV